MFGNAQSNSFYQMRFQARSLVALEGDTDRNRFVLGSLDLKGLLTPSKKEKSRSEKKPKTKGAAKADA